MLTFKEWLLREDAGNPSAKQLLYPMGYGGIGLYPPSDVITWGSDAVVYLPKEMRQLTFNWGDGMLSDPFEKDSLYNQIKGKQAEQLQAGDLQRDSEGFEKVNKYSNIIQTRVIQAGSLDKDDEGFKKTDFIKDSPSKVGLWDYTQIGERPYKLALPVNAAVPIKSFKEWLANS